MATIDGNLWEHNLTLIRVVDVSDDYRLMQPTMPSYCYPVMEESYLPTFRLSDRLPAVPLVKGFKYDWHDEGYQGEPWVVGVIASDLVVEPS